MAHDRLQVVRGDITTLAVDAIVNAANPDLAPGGGVCGAIHRAAGTALAEACRRAGPCATGDARLTPGFGLPARFVIHAVGPVWEGGERGEAEQLASAYRRSLALAREHDLAAVAFPAISTGIYGYPLAAACRVAVDAITAFLATADVPRRVLLCAIDARTEAALRDAVGERRPHPEAEG